MLFNSYEFIFIFFPLVFFLFYYLIPAKHKLLLLLASSYFFYGYWNYKFIPLLLLSTFIDFFVGKKLSLEETQLKRKVWLAVSVIANVGTLVFFKYSNFIIENTNFLLVQIGQEQISLLQNIILPVGISFYTFQSMSYTIDIYRKELKAYDNFLAFATYVSFFPQLIAGPIIRHSYLVKQLEEVAYKKINWDFVSKGIFIFILGLAKKIIIADRIASGINPLIGMMDTISTLEAWLCAIGYTFQLYFDFSGYSDMAIGLGLLLGFQFPQNFNSPYKSFSITDFWRRWHMTLSFWLRDYLYISLGGNRQGKIFTYRNLFLTMIIGGLWHGAAWTFVIWGGFHGALLVIEKATGLNKRSSKKSIQAFQYTFTFSLIVFSWVIFRSENIQLLTEWTIKLFSFDGFDLSSFSAKTRDRFAATLIIGMIMTWFCKNTNELIENFHPTKTKGVLLAILLIISLMFIDAESPFLYFQF